MDDTRWLTPREQQAWRSYLTVVRLVQETVEAQLSREHDIPHAYYEILVMLSEAPERRLRMRDLAEASLSSKSRLSHAVARLQERGWVRRVPSPCDRRSQIAELTDEGFTALAAAAPGHVEQVREAFIDALTPDQLDQLDEIARAVVTHLGREPRTVAGPAAGSDRAVAAEIDRAS